MIRSKRIATAIDISGFTHPCSSMIQQPGKKRETRLFKL